MLKLWHVKRPDRGDYDTYSDFVVAAKNEYDARRTHPSGNYTWEDGKWNGDWGSWINPHLAQVKEIGTAAPDVSGVICASFHAS